MDPAEYDLIHKWVAETKKASGRCRGKAAEAFHPPDNQGLFNAPGTLFESIRSATERQGIEGTQTAYPSELPHQGQPVEPTSSVSQERHGYERRPRHKTRHDRYEYKDPVYRAKVSKKENQKASQRARKHTINDIFHASNVTQDRLTLHSHMNLGIFQKGKTSAPVNSRELPDLAFSEMNFLSKRSQRNHEESFTNAHNEINQSQNMYEDHRKEIPEFFSDRFCEQTDLSYMEKVDNSPGTMNPDPQQGCSSGIDYHSYPNYLGNQTHFNPLLSQSDHDHSHQLKHEGSICGSSPTTTPYSSEHEDSGIEPSIEMYVTGLLLANTDRGDKYVNSEPNWKYFDLEELKCLLEEREKHAKPSSRKRSPPKRLGTRYSPIRERRLENRRRLVKNIRHREKDISDHIAHAELSRSTPSNISGGNFAFDITPQHNNLQVSLTLPEIAVPEQGSAIIPQNLGIAPSLGSLAQLDYPGQNQGYNPLSSDPLTQVPDLKRNAENLTSTGGCDMRQSNTLLPSCPNNQASEELLMQTLDAAYNVIMDSKSSMCESPKHSIANGSLLGSNDGILMSPNDYQDYTSSPFTASFRYLSNPEGHRQQNTLLPYGLGNGNIRQNITQSPQYAHQYLSSGFQPGESLQLGNPLTWQQHNQPAGMDLGVNVSPFGELPGFWRQNKLY
ncbi:hypothetical protein ASPWEDRAFT_41843 [Aspergillus wentii DTO 134E9]|uniref:Uncharacterized protein n=1 Tax=Aspergillus wentii DTO 134E9 TaxID=1073089 RepID=A0A1L9RGD2_ASPWE|nr:uncharacterized protein ASPWEDRAFT_41843 [Aspergillus wentii DTO 134E9]OJJ33954.1 hypothetical protein ASPWEDRAFT_41843 [Aspergillus wentii DTO 134E9]